MTIDRSGFADAARFRWLLKGHGYFMEEQMLCCGHGGTVEQEADAARAAIDAEMAKEGVCAAEVPCGGWVNCANRMPKEDGKYMAIGYRTDAVDASDYGWEASVWLHHGEFVTPQPTMRVTHWLKYATPPYADQPSFDSDQPKADHLRETVKSLRDKLTTTTKEPNE